MALTIHVDSQETHVAIHLAGQVDTKSAPELLDKLTQVGLPELSELRIMAMELTFLSSAGLRALVFARQKMPHASRLVLVGGSEDIKATVIRTGLGNAVTIVDSIAELA
jgi:anti-anti-sigma factor